ncbi:type III-B CRISPR-associated protein Cas10/Cmr2 [Candidatus Venteria ishoeyi]|uniref:CRISPR-associated protein n=1 Tax=Candidatus Venteria ishoeyi TaxID=1899563 RepID=A0A1H6F8F8_9GAMM|nr:type III-B CRISPR-associated protein Cas10/Cmr2 [Candidatus Venteria ishoeyi]SEH05255.1 CRISPR-associated protein [Candidatus Venteria ishoeyi]
MRYFYFTLGPVQDFVSQARRTRDFWAGSFLLSWLSAVAMQSVKNQCTTAELLPEADTHFLDCLQGRGTGKKPTQGSVPNRFRAAVCGGFKADLVVKDVKRAWVHLADIIYAKDLVHFPHVTDKTRDIWDRQVEHFWDISWILVDEKNNAAPNQRKQIRTYFPPEEPGLKCMMMQGWQELSGIETPQSADLEKFWQPIQKNSIVIYASANTFPPWVLSSGVLPVILRH